MDIGQDLARRLHGYEAFDATELAHLTRLHALLATGREAFSRANPIGHVTASALVIDRDARSTLLTHHAKLGKWLQFGGHVEPDDETVLAAALREAKEESGVVGLTPCSEAIFDIDVHTIPVHPARVEPEHLHFDVRFLLVAPGRAFTISDKSNALRWFELDEAVAAAADDSLRRMIRKLRAADGSATHRA